MWLKRKAKNEKEKAVALEFAVAHNGGGVRSFLQLDEKMAAEDPDHWATFLELDEQQQLEQKETMARWKQSRQLDFEVFQEWANV